MTSIDDLEANIRRHLPAARFDRPAGDSKSYHEGFRASGRAKAEKVLSTLRDLEVDLHSCAYVSIGGSYGSEIVWLMENSDLSRGVLLEYDPSVIDEVMKDRERLARMGKDLLFIPGDATQQADSCRRAVESWQLDGNAETVVCSAHAVFHELPTRSPYFHLGSFLHKMLFGWPRTVFISREPCVPSGWPKRVELSVPQLPPEVLEELAREIRRHLRFGGTIRRVGNYIELSDVLAVETLVKLFYAKDLQHEIQERLTTIKPTKFRSELEKYLGPSSVSLRYESSESFKANYRNLKICARHPTYGNELSIPLAFCEFVGDSRRSTSVPESKSSTVVMPAKQVEIVRKPPPSSSAIGTEPATLKLTRKTGRYLRRRCRVITPGTKGFQAIMYSLLSRQYDREEAIKRFEESWETLKKPYEQVMTHAAYLECMGDIESMQRVLEKPRFTGVAESARMLYVAIAREKLDDLDSAQQVLRNILDTEKHRDMVRAAQFNMHVCYEKAANFGNVNFEAFLEDRGISFVDHERLRDKAVAMQMIVCIEQGRPFIYRHLLDESLEFLSKNSRAGYVKTLLTKIECEKLPLTEVTIDAIIKDLQLMDANSRTAVMVRLSEYLPGEAEALRQSILDRVRQEPGKSETVNKWKRAYRPPIGGDGSAS